MKTVFSNSLRGLTVLAGIFALSMILMPAALAQGKQDFTLVNKTGIAINELFIGPNSSEDWGDDILGLDTLPNGESTDIVFDPKTKAARWDIQLIDENGRKHTKYDINLIRVATIIVTSKPDGTWYFKFE
jgi:hypothetical protein